MPFEEGNPSFNSDFAELMGKRAGLLRKPAELSLESAGLIRKSAEYKSNRAESILRPALENKNDCTNPKKRLKLPRDSKYLCIKERFSCHVPYGY